MQGNSKRELLTGLQYLLIGVIAEVATIRWFNHRTAYIQLLIWAGIAVGLGLVRFFVLSLSEWTRRNQWQSVSRRNWD